jgi:hypothetical protein
VNIPPNRQSLPLGAKFTPRGKLNPWGQTMLLKTGLWRRTKLVRTKFNAPFRNGCFSYLPTYIKDKTFLREKMTSETRTKLPGGKVNFTETLPCATPPELPDFSSHMIPKQEKMYQKNTKCTKWS